MNTPTNIRQVAEEIYRDLKYIKVPGHKEAVEIVDWLEDKLTRSFPPSNESVEEKAVELLKKIRYVFDGNHVGKEIDAFLSSLSTTGEGKNNLDSKKYVVQLDGNAWVSFNESTFINLHDSDAAFADSPPSALSELIRMENAKESLRSQGIRHWKCNNCQKSFDRGSVPAGQVPQCVSCRAGGQYVVEESTPATNTCGKCRGDKGWYFNTAENNKWYACPTCKGSGTVPVEKGGEA